jgi:alanine racemase
MEYSRYAVQCGGTLKVHIKVDTGMTRLGFSVRGDFFDDSVAAIARACALPNLEAEGIFTHMAVSDEPTPEGEAYTREQFALFTGAIDALKAQGRTFLIRHCANSGVTVLYPEMALDMVRPGIILYGASELAGRLGLKPVMQLKTTVYSTRSVAADTTISYGRTFRTVSPTRTGVLPIGYADGLLRCFSNRLSVMTVQGPAPVLGRICMDMCIVDLTELDQVQAGDTVEIFGDVQSVNDLAAMAGTIPYELMCAVSRRVPRVYLENGIVCERSLYL